MAIEALQNLVHFFKPPGEIIGYINAPLYLPADRLNSLKVFSLAEVRKRQKWYTHEPMAIFAVRRTTTGETIFRPTRFNGVLIRSIVTALEKDYV